MTLGKERIIVVMITDWLMVIITAIYVVATILILRANQKSAKITEKQLEASKLQFMETQRLSVLPYLSVDIGDTLFQETDTLPIFDLDLWLCPIENNENHAWINRGIIVTNIGAGLVSNLKVKWIVDGNTFEYPLPIVVLCCNDKRIINTSISGEYRDTLFSQKAHLVFCFSDVLGNRYEQTLELNLSLRPFDQRMTIDTYKMQEPIFLDNS